MFSLKLKIPKMSHYFSEVQKLQKGNSENKTIGNQKQNENKEVL